MQKKGHKVCRVGKGDESGKSLGVEMIKISKKNIKELIVKIKKEIYKL